MSDGNRIAIYYKKNGGAYGTIPAGNGKTLRFASESLEQTTQRVKSKEIRADRMTPGHIRVGYAVAGSLEGELSYGAQDDLIEAALLSAAWTGAVTVSGTNISAAASDNSINSASSAFGSVVAGQWLRVEGFTTNGARFWCKVVTQTAAKLIVSGITLVNETAGASISVKGGDKVQVGTTFSDYVFERDHDDLATVFADFLGCGIDTIDLNADVGGILTIAFGVIGKLEQANSSTQMGTPTAAPTADVMNASDHPYKIWEGGLTPATETTAIKIGLKGANNLAARLELGSAGATSIRAGSFDCTVTLTGYFTGNALKTKYLADTRTSFAFLIRDGAYNAYVFELPAMKIGKCKTAAGGINTDCVAEVELLAERDTVSGQTLIIHRIAA